MEWVVIALLLVLGYIAYLRFQITAQQREFAEYKKNVVIVPIPKKKQSPWIALFAISTLVLAIAVFILALR